MTGTVLAALAVAIPASLALTALALPIGAVLGLGLCALRLSRLPVLRALGGAMILALRCVPPVLWLLLAFHGFGAGPDGVGAFAPATLGLGAIAAGRFAEIYRGALSAVPTGQWEAAAALHLPARSVAVEVVGPQLLRLAVPAIAACALGILKDSALASILGVGEIAFAAAQAARSSADGLVPYAVATALYLVIGLPLAAAARRAGRQSWTAR